MQYKPWMLPFIKMYVHLTPEMIGLRFQIYKIDLECMYLKLGNTYRRFQIARLKAQLDSLKEK